MVFLIMNLAAFHAMARFGLGQSPQDASAAERDPRGWLTAQLSSPETPTAIQQMLQQSEGLHAMAAFLAARKEGDKMDKPELHHELRDSYLNECALRFNAQQSSTQPLIERLVMFWSNHFTVSIQKPILAGLVNHFESTAIRPHVTGKFSDMLLASSHHPAMLLYLDNQQSIGPNSLAGQRRQKSYNENLAREIMELHTLGVGGGYTQEDVIALAKIITGWTLRHDGGIPSPEFAFEPRMHEPGPKVLLGQTFAENGEAEGNAALLMLARHPATAKHIATKLCRHFIANDPPPAAVAEIAQVFTQTDGDLRAVTLAIINGQEAWQTILTKVKSPYEFAISSMRLLNVPVPNDKVAPALVALDYKIFGAPSPAGYPDDAAAWASPDAVMKRIEWAQQITRKIQSRENPVELAEAMFGPAMREETRKIINGAPSGQEGLAFLLTSPEFMRR
jgi:uncharacterized protein (DUF1800 family)